MSENRIRLPLDCDAWYQPGFLAPSAAQSLYDEIFDHYPITDKRIPMADGSEHIAETGSYIFTDAELTSHDALPPVWGGRAPWFDALARIRERIADATGVRFRVARCIYYRDGSEGVDFHRDLPAYGDTRRIASLSLGAEREFVLRRVDDEAQRHALRLAPGSLLYMGEGSQQRYEHALPHDPECAAPRINITFRCYGWEASADGG